MVDSFWRPNMDIFTYSVFSILSAPLVFFCRGGMSAFSEQFWCCYVRNYVIFNTVARCVNAVRTNDKKSHATNFHSDPATNQRAPAKLMKKKMASGDFKKAPPGLTQNSPHEPQAIVHH